MGEPDTGCPRPNDGFFRSSSLFISFFHGFHNHDFCSLYFLLRPTGAKGERTAMAAGAFSRSENTARLKWLEFMSARSAFFQIGCFAMNMIFIQVFKFCIELTFILVPI